MELLKIYLIILLTSIINYSSAQDWIRVYTNQGWGLAPRGLIETYDRGYIILCDANNYKLNLLLKTDLNGYEIWRKGFAANSYPISPESIEQTSDFGYIIAGSMSKYGTSDAFILKLNSCLEKEWCKVLHTDNYYDDYGQDVKQLPDGGYVLLTRYYDGIDPGHRINLHKLDQNGELIWQNNFAENDSLLFGEEGLNLLIINNNEYLITGYGFYPDSGQIGGWRRPLLIKVDSTGTEYWETIWGADSYFYGRPWFNSIVDNSGNIYNLGYHRVGSDAKYPVLFKTSSNGHEMFYSDLVDTCFNGDAAVPTWMEDSLIFANIGWWNWDQSLFWGFIKVDTIGNIIDIKDISEPPVATVSIVKTFDNKYLSVGIYNNEELNRWEIYAYKLNSDLEYDTIYTTPFVYDSLCPYRITSDTTDLDCDILVLVDDQFVPLYEVKLKIFPNPATNNVTMSYPDLTHKGQREIVILNNLGVEVKHIRLMRGDEETQTNISDLPSGIYFVALMENGHRIAASKMVVSK
jgi:hypothetical protein